ncbi:hypothetical protein [Croceicoccus naphthovorans]|nr:hypothetical protein [Croceicoccus naphthovorans]MBB3989122.1 hypothetical protein [Croceicoccus naphthovorans]
MHALARGSAVEITDVSGYWAKFTFGDGIGFSDFAASHRLNFS